MFKKKTHKDFVEELLIKNPNIKVLGEYINARTKIKVQCLIDDHIWYATPDNLLRGYGCPKCAGNAVKTQNEFKNELAITHPEITLLSQYVKSNEKVHVLCNDCGNDF